MEQSYRHLFERNLAGLFRVTLDGKILDCNRAALQMAGYESVEELRQQKISDFFPDRQDLKAFAAQLNDERSVVSMEFSLKRKNGDPFWVLINAWLVEEPEGPVVEGTFVDITERVRAEEYLSIQYGVTRIMAETDSVDDAMPRILQRICETFLWQAGEYRMVRKDSGALLWRAFWQSPELQRQTEAELPEEFVQRIRAGNTGGWTAEFRDEGFEKILFFPVRSHDHLQGLLLFYSTDSAEPQPKLMRMLDSLARQIEYFLRKVRARTAQLEATIRELENFSYSISHDLRAPLRAIDGFSRILVEDYRSKLDEEGQRVLEVIMENAKIMGQLIDGLLSFSRLGRRHMDSTSIDMESLVRTVVNSFKEDSKFRWNIHPLPRAKGDPAMIQEVLRAIISNAVKFSRHRESSEIEIGAEAGGKENTYFVRDQGIGFDQKYSGKIFGVFQRLHRSEDYEGIGLGLAIAQRILHRHGGKIWAEAKPNEGARFSFTLPVG